MTDIDATQVEWAHVVSAVCHLAKGWHERGGRVSIISTSNFKMSLKSLIFTESYYFHVYVFSCDVHFRYSDDAFMWIA